jgi:hypothetical protein
MADGGVDRSEDGSGYTDGGADRSGDVEYGAANR